MSLASSRVSVRPANADDFVSYFRRSPQEDWHGWLGWVAQRDGKLAGMGGVYFNSEYFPIAFFEKLEPLPAVTMHRLVLAGLKELGERGLSMLYAPCDETVSIGPRWMKALGFERIKDGLWRKALR